MPRIAIVNVKIVSLLPWREACWYEFFELFDQEGLMLDEIAPGAGDPGAPACEEHGSIVPTQASNGRHVWSWRAVVDPAIALSPATRQEVRLSNTVSMQAGKDVIAMPALRVLVAKSCSLSPAIAAQILPFDLIKSRNQACRF